MRTSEILAALPAPIYLVDAEGRLTFFNEAATQLWGRRPEIGSVAWCGSWRLFRPDGTPMAHEECPLAMVLKGGPLCTGAEMMVERPDGIRIPLLSFPGVLKDASGQVTGGINLLIDITERKRTELADAWLGAIVANSDDAIISKTLDGTVTSWNDAANRIFGYSAEEMIGESVRRIIPQDLQSEEDDILAKLRRGERIDHFDTERLAKDGSRVAISLTVSPILDRAGKIIGASKIVRDIGERKQNEEMQHLLLEELNHRVKNTLATVHAIATQSMRNSTTPADFVLSFNGRVQALGRAHELLVQQKMQGASLLEIVRDQVILGAGEGDRVSCSGPDLTLDSRLAVQLALVLHELATNARKYGALSRAAGRLSITWDVTVGAGRELRLRWEETGVPGVEAPRSHGFGSTLINRTLEANGGDVLVRYEADGLRYDIRLPIPNDSGRRMSATGVIARKRLARSAGAVDQHVLRDKRVLIIEDEPLVAMDMEAELTSLGLDVVGSVSTVEDAIRTIEAMALDAALLDANLHGEPVGRIAEALSERAVPFAFATGYGRDALPEAFRNVPILAKPFDGRRLGAVMLGLLAPSATGSSVIPLRSRP